MKQLPPPIAFGLPEKFTDWRKYQSDSILDIASPDRPRCSVQICPTGSGKSLMYITAAILRGGRTLFLTSTKGLQNQLINDFEEIGLVDIRGRNSYPCRAKPGAMCDQGPCTSGKVKCHLKHAGCAYYDAVHAAKNSNLVVTNYAYWLTINKFHVKSNPIGAFNTIVCDEAHDTPEVISSFLTTRLDRHHRIVDSVPLPVGVGDMTLSKWKGWGEALALKADHEIEDLEDDYKEYESDNDLKQLLQARRIRRSAHAIINMDEDWVWDSGRGYFEFSPVWPAEQCEGLLFKGIGKVAMTSATVCAKTMEMLGANPNDMEINEYPHTFPAENRMLYYIPTVRLNRHSTPEDMRAWRTRIDQIIRKRQDRKGIVHTVSYARKDNVMINSNYSAMMISHGTKDLPLQVRNFKAAQEPLILVSPSIATGYDFPYSECEYQIIGKVPYPDTRSKLMKARCDKDKDYAPYIAMMNLVQICGRGNRAMNDHCENFCVDDNIKWFKWKYAHFAPKYWHDAYRQIPFIPEPPEALLRAC